MPPLVAFALAFCWGLGILVSLLGWGSLLNRLLLPSVRGDVSLRAAWGLALSVTIGGVFNLSGQISRASILAFLAVGILFSLGEVTRSLLGGGGWRVVARARSGYVAVAMAAGLAGLALFATTVAAPQFPGPVFPRNFNPHDDFQAYFVFPGKMLETGSLGPDPFNERRQVSGFGGQSFLHTFVLSLLPERHLYMIDPGLGTLLVLGLAWGEMTRRRAPPWTIALVLGALLLIPPPTVNTSSLMTGAALLLAYGRTVAWEPLQRRFGARSGLESLLVAAICSLKFSLLPAAAITLATCFILRLVRSDQPRQEIRALALTLILVTIFLAPWSLAFLISTGTPLYPVLGRGYHLGLETAFPLASSHWWTGTLEAHLSNPLVVAIMVMVGVLLARRMSAWHERVALISLATGAFFGALTTTYALRGFDAYRFAFPVAFPCFVYQACAAAGAGAVGHRWGWRRILMGSVGAGALLLAVLGTPHRRTAYFQGMLEATRFGLQGTSLTTEQERHRHRQIQEAVPAGAPLLARLARPYLMDFSRQAVFVPDRPGQSGPSPGFPYLRGSEALADYLEAGQVRFVAYDYALEGGFSRSRYATRVLPGATPWGRDVALRTLDFQDSLAELGRSRHKLYDDGQTFVIDLARQAEPGRP